MPPKVNRAPMSPLARLAAGLAPFLVFLGCGSDDENAGSPKGKGGADSIGGEGGRGDGGESSGSAGEGGAGTSGRGGSGASSPGGEAGEAGTPGESGSGGSAGSPPEGGAPSAGMGGSGGSAGVGGGGIGGGSCTTVTVPLRSADFDDDTSAWLSYDAETGPARPIVVSAASAGITAESDPNVAHLAGANDANAGIYQPISIPMGAVSMTLTGYRQATTEEQGTVVFDEMGIHLYEDAVNATGFAGEFVAFGSDAPTTDWVPFAGTVNVEDHAGRTLDFNLWAESDGSLVTHFYVDSLVLTASVCR